MHQLFTGNALCGVDKAGRLVLPAFVRATLARRTDRPAVLVGPHESDACLVGCDPGHIESLVEDLRRRRLLDEASAPGAHHPRARRVFGLLEEARVDRSGTILLSPMMRRRARIDDLALVLGTGDMFEIWSPSVALESGDAGLADLAAFHLDIPQAA